MATAPSSQTLHLTQHQQAAIRAGRWLARNQIHDKLDANRGRYIYARNLDTGYTERSTGWQTGFGAMACLSLHRLTGDQAWLDSAALAMDYLRSIQILDSRRRHIFGAFREETPQTQWLHPRDAVSAAWGMLCYGKYTGDSDCLERARLYADWMLDYAFRGDWPICTVKLGEGGLDVDDTPGSFQAGGILFFLDLFEVTRDIRYSNVALRMSEYHVRHLLKEDGHLEILIDPLGNNSGIHDNEKWPTAWRDMHRVNDDFGGIAMARSYRVFRQETYLQRLKAFSQTLLARQNPDGGFLEPESEAASAAVPIFLRSYRPLADPSQRAAIDAANDRCLRHLLTLQQSHADPAVDGAFLGLDHRCRCGNKRWINIRCTAYAIIALLLQSGHSVFPLDQTCGP